MAKNSFLVCGAVLAAGLFARPAPAAPRALPLAEALNRLESQGLQARILALEEKEATAERAAAIAFRNPELRYAGEALEGNGEDAREWTLGIQKTFANPGAYWSRRRSARHRQFGLEQRLRGRRQEAAALLRETYLATQLARREVEALETLAAMADAMEKAGQARFEENAIAPFELFRLSAARLELHALRQEKESEALAGSRKLAFWLFPGEAVEVVPDSAPIPPASPDTAGWQAHLEESPEIQARKQEALAAKAESRAEAFDLFPELSLAAGWKRQSDGLDGIGFEASAPIPLFGWNGGARARESARARRLALELEWTRLELRRELEKTLRDWGQGSQRLKLSAQLLRRHPFPRLAGALEASYLEGDKPAFEVLDGLSSLYESLAAHHRALMEQEQAANKIRLLLGGNNP